MRIDCNEKGFHENDVRAICKIGASTEVAGRVRNFIGEKGIGFKAVFKAANKVFIRSNGFSFKFDTTESENDLGMLLPVCSDFPSLVIEEKTQFLLRLKPETSKYDLIDTFSKMDSTMLLFLRSLHCVKISLPKGVEITFSHTSQADSKIITLKSERTLSTSNSATSENDYLKIESILKNPPSDTRRKGIHETPIILAFPLRNRAPIVQHQHAFAFMPIKDFGFQVSTGVIIRN